MRQILNTAKTKISARFWVELVAGAVSVVAVAVTSIWPQWIEAVFGADPDAGSGEAEWGLTVAFCAFAVVMFALARREWKRVNLGENLR